VPGAPHSPDLPHLPGATAPESDYAEVWTAIVAATLRRVLSTDISKPGDRELALRVCAYPDAAYPLLVALADSAPFAELTGKVAKAILPRFHPARPGPSLGMRLGFTCVVAEMIARTSEGDDNCTSSIQFK
jgi:hypothetical protein